MSTIIKFEKIHILLEILPVSSGRNNQHLRGIYASPIMVSFSLFLADILFFPFYSSSLNYHIGYNHNRLLRIANINFQQEQIMWAIKSADELSKVLETYASQSSSLRHRYMYMYLQINNSHDHIISADRFMTMSLHFSVTRNGNLNGKPNS